jgi:two-component system NtrC family sensor kinase
MQEPLSEPVTGRTHTDGDSQESAEAPALAAIAHELRSPLQVLANLLHLIEHDADNPSLRERVAQAQREVERIRQITAGLLGASRVRSSESQVELSKVLGSSLEYFKEKIDFKRITIERRFECSGIMRSLPVDIRQVFDNVLANALEAVPIGGRVIIHLYASRDWKDASRSGYRLVVFDNAPGMPPSLLSKIFDPFFTTKVEKGTGIGLWVVQRIVRKQTGIDSCAKQHAVGYARDSLLNFPASSTTD